jgi:hypothetical protein
MRRVVKEKLVRFDGRPLFPDRFAYSPQLSLSDPEAALYVAVTDYVREEMNRVERLEAAGEGRRGRLCAHDPAAPARLIARGDLPLARAAAEAPRGPASRGAH